MPLSLRHTYVRSSSNADGLTRVLVTADKSKRRAFCQSPFESAGTPYLLLRIWNWKIFWGISRARKTFEAFLGGVFWVDCRVVVESRCFHRFTSFVYLEKVWKSNSPSSICREYYYNFVWKSGNDEFPSRWILSTTIRGSDDKNRFGVHSTEAANFYCVTVCLTQQRITTLENIGV